MKRRRETLCLSQQDLAEMVLAGLAAINDIKAGTLTEHTPALFVSLLTKG